MSSPSLPSRVLCFGLAAGFCLTTMAGAPRSVSAVLVEESPILDGRLEEQEWNRAPAADQFVQQWPVQGVPSTERTEARFLYTEEALYIGVICFDSHPELILDTQSRRDGDLSDSDSIQVILDTYHDGQNGFLFGTNPSGIQYDAQILNEGVSGGQTTSSGVGRSVAGSARGPVAAVNVNWDTTWEVESRQTERGWETEIRIPLKSLRYRNSEGPQQWGLNLMRNIRRKNEQAFWAEIPQAYNIYRLSLAGDLEALEIRSQRNLKVIPYVLTGVQRDFPAQDTDFRKDVGVDLKYGLSSALTLDLTVNTDFAQVEVDDEQINLTRFPLFFPEKRAFFLENAGTFSFGTPREVDLFFSRRIGIDRGLEIPIRAGARLTGKVDRFNLGILSIQTGEEEGEVAAQNFFVGRVRREFSKRSSAGVIFTNRESIGDPQGGSEHNRAWGADIQLGLGEFWILSGYVAKTHTPELAGEDWAGNVFLGYKSNLWRIQASYLEVRDNFNPEVGFVQRKGFRKPDFRIFFTPTPKSGPIRQWNPHYSIRRFYGIDGELETERQHHDMEVFLTNGGVIGLTLNRDYEFLREPFEVHPGVIVPAGVYKSNEYSVALGSDPSAAVFGEINISLGGFLGGDIESYDLEVGFRNGAKFLSTFTLVNTTVDADWGHFNTSLGRARISYSFTPYSFLQALVQYNSRAQQFSSNIRLGLINSAGTGLYVVYNDGYATPGERFDPLQRALFVKYSYQIDF